MFTGSMNLLLKKKKVEIIFVGGGGLKKEYYQIDLAREAVGLGYLSSQAQHNKNNLDSETEEIDLPKEPEALHSSRDCIWTTQAIGLKIEEGSRDMQATQGGNFQIKHPSPLHLMHFTNSANRINGKMTPE